ncbi:MAG TPA: SPOR domain-containing protein [Gemmatimonadaceae bacterium]|jgi:cell division septation protein DedD|nr:SPOR domain-containing protein [Gemmatimonadaceae bacterium]
MKRLVLSCALLVIARAPTMAQSSSNANADSVFARARRLVASGNGAAGRLLVDSVLAATDPNTPQYADALYWRATLSTNGADAERDYRRIVVEYGASMRSGDALLQLAQLESARGERATAADHLERFLLENPGHPERTRASLTLVRMLVDQNDLPRACSTLRQALREIPDSEVETRNQLTYYSSRCVANDASPGSRVPVGEPTTPKDSASMAKRDSSRSAAAPEAKARYTLQVAAYGSRSDATALASRLKARGVEARVVGAAKPFRVRIGRYATRAEAVAAQSRLKARKIAVTITDIGADDR